MQFRRKRRPETAPDITPLIDVVFLLLIFFMLSTTFIVQPRMKIDLPEASAEGQKKEKEEIKVSISRDGDLYLGDRETDLDELRKAFAEAAARSRESIVIINADERAFHGRVVEVMDSAKEAGITRLAIATEPK